MFPSISYKIKTKPKIPPKQQKSGTEHITYIIPFLIFIFTKYFISSIPIPLKHLI